MSPPLTVLIDMSHRLRLVFVSSVIASLWLTALVGFIVTKQPEPVSTGQLWTFDSKRELADFLKKDRNSDYSLLIPKYSTGDYGDALDAGGAIPHSETNVQTTGVDEADMIKTDGEYIYTATGRTVSIVKASPATEMEVVATLGVEEALGLNNSSSGYICGLFLYGDRLVVLGNTYGRYTHFYGYDMAYADEVYKYAFDYERQKTLIAVYDVSTADDPRRELLAGISGSLMTSRMINGVVYLLSQDFVGYLGEDNLMPTTWEEGKSREVALSTVKYDPQTQHPNSFINILALDTADGSHSSLSIVAGWSSTVYMSKESLYFAIQKWEGDVVVVDDEDVIGPDDASSAKTTIYRIATDGLHMTDSARGDVKGWLLNQFSMDEYGGKLRVATTTGWSLTQNAVYVLDDSLQVVGALERLAPTERIYSARFVGETLYLVTFRQIDPLFVIDLSNPEDPKVSGELKIPGFSSYLHPVDESHVLGIGLEGGYVKVSLFNVSDPTAPVEQSELLIEGLYSSPVLYDHKAVLFDLERELLVIPGRQTNWLSSDWNYTCSCTPAAYVLRVSLSEGISLMGVILHEVVDSGGYGEVTRSLTIGDHLYTLCNCALQANLLADLSFVGKVGIDSCWSDGHYGY